MEVDYALVTSSALPEQVKQSESFMHIDEGQWRDLLQYSKEIEASSSKEKILVLLVAQGTPEEDKLEEEKALQAEQERKELERLKEFEQQKLEEENKQKEQQLKLRTKSKEIINAIYGR